MVSSGLLVPSWHRVIQENEFASISGEFPALLELHEILPRGWSSPKPIARNFGSPARLAHCLMTIRAGSSELAAAADRGCIRRHQRGPPYNGSDTRCPNRSALPRSLVPAWSQNRWSRRERALRFPPVFFTGSAWWSVLVNSELEPPLNALPPRLARSLLA